MKTIEINIYKFDELSDEAKANAIERLRSINVDHDWWNSTYEDAERIGLKLESFDLDRNRHADGSFLLSANEVAQNIFNEHGEGCDTFKMATSFMAEWGPIFNDYMDENSPNYENYQCEVDMQENEDEFLKSLLECYSVILQNESEYLQSKESIIETIKANDYDFLKNGELY